MTNFNIRLKKEIKRFLTEYQVRNLFLVDYIGINEEIVQHNFLQAFSSIVPAIASQN